MLTTLRSKPFVKRRSLISMAWCSSSPEDINIPSNCLCSFLTIYPPYLTLFIEVFSRHFTGLLVRTIALGLSFDDIIILYTPATSLASHGL